MQAINFFQELNTIFNQSQHLYLDITAHATEIKPEDMFKLFQLLRGIQIDEEKIGTQIDGEKIGTQIDGEKKSKLLKEILDASKNITKNADKISTNNKLLLDKIIQEIINPIQIKQILEANHNNLGELILAFEDHTESPIVQAAFTEFLKYPSNKTALSKIELPQSISKMLKQQSPYTLEKPSIKRNAKGAELVRRIFLGSEEDAASAIEEVLKIFGYAISEYSFYDGDKPLREKAKLKELQQESLIPFAEFQKVILNTELDIKGKIGELREIYKDRHAIPEVPNSLTTQKIVQRTENLAGNLTVENADDFLKINPHNLIEIFKNQNFEITAKTELLKNLLTIEDNLNKHNNFSRKIVSEISHITSEIITPHQLQLILEANLNNIHELVLAFENHTDTNVVQAAFKDFLVWDNNTSALFSDKLSPKAAEIMLKIAPEKTKAYYQKLFEDMVVNGSFDNTKMEKFNVVFRQDELASFLTDLFQHNKIGLDNLKKLFFPTPKLDIEILRRGWLVAGAVVKLAENDLLTKAEFQKVKSKFNLTSAFEIFQIIFKLPAEKIREIEPDLLENLITELYTYTHKKETVANFLILGRETLFALAKDNNDNIEKNIEKLQEVFKKYIDDQEIKEEPKRGSAQLEQLEQPEPSSSSSNRIDKTTPPTINQPSIAEFKKDLELQIAKMKQDDELEKISKTHTAFKPYIRWWSPYQPKFTGTEQKELLQNFINSENITGIEILELLNLAAEFHIQSKFLLENIQLSHDCLIKLAPIAHKLSPAAYSLIASNDSEIQCITLELFTNHYAPQSTTMQLANFLLYIPETLLFVTGIYGILEIGSAWKQFIINYDNEPQAANALKIITGVSTFVTGALGLILTNTDPKLAIGGALLALSLIVNIINQFSKPKNHGDLELTKFVKKAEDQKSGGHFLPKYLPWSGYAKRQELIKEVSQAEAEAEAKAEERAKQQAAIKEAIASGKCQPVAF